MYFGRIRVYIDAQGVKATAVRDISSTPSYTPLRIRLSSRIAPALGVLQIYLYTSYTLSYVQFECVPSDLRCE